MEIINAVYKNGVLVLLDKIDMETLKSKRLSVNIVDEDQYRKSKSDKLKSIYKYIHKSNPFGEIKDVVKWQKQIRIDREVLN